MWGVIEPVQVVLIALLPTRLLDNEKERGARLGGEPRA